MKKLFISVLLLCVCLFVCTTALAANYMFTSTINEMGNKLLVNLNNVSQSVQGNYFIINAYKENKLVANEVVKANFSSSSMTINCSDKPDDVKISIWDTLASVKPLTSYIDFDSTSNDGVQTFSPSIGFPEDFYTVKGVLVGNEKTFIENSAQMYKGYIRVQVYDDYNNYNNYITLYAPDIDSDYYLGKSVSVSYTETDSGYVLKSIKETGANTVAKIEDTTYIMPNEAPRYPSYFVYDYYAYGLSGILSVYNDEVDSTNTEYKLDGANIIYNGAWVDADNFVFPAMASAELLDNDGDGRYELIFVTEYKTYVVDSVYGANKKIGMKIGPSIDLTNFIEGKEGYIYSITLDGKEIDITDLKENDVLSVAADQYNGSAKVYDIIVSRNVIEGVVESIDPNYNHYKTVYTIAGKEYRIANSAEFSVPTITSTTEGKFYIDYFGKIAMYEAPNVLETGTLAFIQGMGEYDSLGDTQYEIELLNKDGSVVIYTLADNVTVKQNNEYKVIDRGGALVDGSGKSSKHNVAEYIACLLYNCNEPSYDFAQRVITYKANASGKITQISFADNYAMDGLSIAPGYQYSEYDASVNALGAYGVTDDTIIFYVPAYASKDKYRVTDISMLVDGKCYDTAYIGIDEDLNASVVVITSDSISINDCDPLSVVTGSVTSTNSDGDSYVTVTFLQNGEEKTLPVAVDAEINYYDNFPRGAIFEYSVNSEGFMDDAAFCGARYNSTAFNLEDVITSANTGDVFPTKKVGNTDFSYIAGYVVGKSGSTLTLNTEFYNTYGDRVAIPDTANIYMIDASQTKIVPQKATIGDISKCQYYMDDFENYIIEKDCDTYVIIKYVDKTITDVIVYSNLSYFEGYPPLAYVTSSEVNSDNCIEVTFIDYYGEPITLALSKDCKYNTPENNVFTKGSRFRYLINEAGEICDIYDESFVVPFDIYKNLAYIQGIGEYESFGEEQYEIALLNKDGSTVVYNLAESISVNIDQEYTVKVSKHELADMLEEKLYSYGSTFSPADRIISYKTNAKGEITYILFAQAKMSEGLNYVSFTEEYDSSNGFTTANLKNDAIIFYIPAYGTKDEYEICTPAVFEDGETYSVSVFDINKELCGGLAVITSTIDVDYSDSLATVVSSEVTDNKLSVTITQDGQTKTLTVSEKCDYYMPENNPFTKGSTFRYTLNLKGEIYEIYDEVFVYESITDTNLAFVMGLGEYYFVGETHYEVKLLNKDGSVVIYTLADTLSVNKNKTSMGKMNKNDVAEMLEEKLYTTSNNALTYANRIISYKVNASGKITSITFADNNASEGLSVANGSEHDEYDASVSALMYGVTDETIIFYLPVYASYDEYRILNLSHLRDGCEYATAYLDIDEDYNAGIMIITGDSISLGDTSPLAVTTGSVITTNSDGDRVIKVSFLQDGEQKTLMLDADAYINDIDNNPFTRGSLFEYALNFDGEISDAQFCGFGLGYPLSWMDVKQLSDNGEIPTKNIGNCDYEYIGGYVIAKNGSTLTLAQTFDAAAGDRIVIPATANIYTMDVTKSKVVPKVASIGDITPVECYYDGYEYVTEEGYDTFVIIKYIDDKIVDVVAYTGLIWR